MQKSEVQVSPLVIDLNTMDYWCWCKYFIDLKRRCSYNCSYCNTLHQTDLSQLELLPELPEHNEPIGLGLLSDFYQPDDSGSTTAVLELLYRKGHPVSILTKSDKIVNDLPVLQKFSKQGKLKATFTIITPHNDLAEKLEGCAPTPYQRLDALGKLAEAGISTGIAITPIIPMVTDDREALALLVKEAKKRGAGWVLFSGFNPVKPFMKDPLWEKTSMLHADRKKLQEHYRDIKKFMLGLLHSQGLPIRIPRVTFNLPEKHYYSYLVSEYLLNISYFYELMENRLEAMRYRRAGLEINNTEYLMQVVKSNTLGFLRGVNPHIEKTVQEIIYQGKSSLYEKLYRKLTS
ncbi:MAG: radical SAM protein [Spirochaetota bacterium]